MLLTDDLLLNYKRCQRRVFLDKYQDRSKRDPERDFLDKLRSENQKHIAQVIANRVYHRPDAPWSDWQTRAKQTKSLMAQGVDCIYQGILWQSTSPELQLLLANLTGQVVEINWQGMTLVGQPTLLVKQPGWSEFGNWFYSPINIKLGRRPKAEYKLISAFHGYLLAAIQGVLPDKWELILKDINHYPVEQEIWLNRLQEVLEQCTQMLYSHQEPEVFISRQRCSLCQWYSYCHNVAQSTQHLCLVPGITPRRYEQLKELGINSLNSLAFTSITQISEDVDQEITAQLKQQARSILENIPLIKSTASTSTLIPTAPIELYFDIEAEPERSLDYLLGVLLVNRLTNEQNFYAFLAQTPEEEELAWQQFLQFIDIYADAPIFHFSGYELETIKRLGELYQTPSSQVEAVINRLVDLHEQVMLAVTFPVESYSLKSLANWIGFEWRDQGVSGDQSICWYDQWLKTKQPELLESILRYNEDDCRATYVLKEWLVNFLVNELN